MCNSDRQEIGHSIISWILILFSPTLYLGIKLRGSLVYKLHKTGYIAALGLLYLLKISYWNIWLNIRQSIPGN